MGLTRRMMPRVLSPSLSIQSSTSAAAWVVSPRASTAAASCLVLYLAALTAVAPVGSQAVAVLSSDWASLQSLFSALCIPFPSRFQQSDCSSMDGVVEYDALEGASDFDVVYCNENGAITTVYINSVSPDNTPFPTVVTQLSALTHIDFAFTDLSGPLPAEISALTNLVKLRLQFNSLCGSLPSLTSLVALTELRLTGNRFTGPVPSQVLPVLRIANNYFTGSLSSYYSNNLQCPTTYLENCLTLGTPGQCLDQQRTTGCSSPPTCATPVRTGTCKPATIAVPFENCVASAKPKFPKCGKKSRRQFFCTASDPSAICYNKKNVAARFTCVCPCEYTPFIGDKLIPSCRADKPGKIKSNGLVTRGGAILRGV